MKTNFIIVVLVFSQVCYGQVTGEWLSQKKTQKKYLLDQIGALKIYGSYLSKGYAITKGGLGEIKGIKDKSLSQDRSLFESLRIVSPMIRQYKKVKDIISIQVQISKQVQLTVRYALASKGMTGQEIEYLQSVFAKVNIECENDLDRLMKVITSNELEMSDDERLKEIDKLYELAIDKQNFTSHFSTTAKGLIVQRKAELR